MPVRRVLEQACRAEGVCLAFRRHGAASARAERQELSRQLLARTLARASGYQVSASGWQLTRASAGGIEVSAPEQGWSVSVAYAHGLTVSVASRGRAVGVDLEAMTEWPSADRPDELLSPHEHVLVRADPATLLLVWTLKEAQAKERGRGFMQGGAHLDVAPLALAPAGVWAQREDGGLAMHAPLALAGARYQLAIALDASRSTVAGP